MISCLPRYSFTCDDCGVNSHFDDKSTARSFGWCVSHIYKHDQFPHIGLVGLLCWCPNCSVNHRRGRPRRISR